MAFNYALALTGGIATGKSSSVKILSDLGFHCIDADKIAHEMLELHQDKIATLFGDAYIKEGKVDRKALGALIFSNPIEKQRLEGLLHPLIYAEIERLSIEEDKFDVPYLVDIPLFFETKRYPIEKSIVVYTPREKQLSRLMQRDGFSQEEAEQRIKAQISIEEKREEATYIIDNSKDLKHLYVECCRIKEQILKDFKE